MFKGLFPPSTEIRVFIYELYWGVIKNVRFRLGIGPLLHQTTCQIRKTLSIETYNLLYGVTHEPCLFTLGREGQFCVGTHEEWQS